MIVADERAMPPVWTVTSLTAAIRSRLEGDFPCVDVEAEISGWKVYSSGHAYFTLKDDAAQISAVMFKSSLDACPDASSFTDGAKVKVRGRITVYPPRGNYQLVVSRMKLAGLGELMRRYLELKAKLEFEGLFSAARKRPLPFMPRRIGVVTSESGAVIHDICRVLTRRFPNLEVRLFPALVQGAEAPKTLIAGLDYFNQGEWPADLVIIGRGGGSFEDLYCFNDEALVRAVAASRLPVISAVGHETDYTLCDFAADLRAGTPSIAAEIVVPVKDELLKKLDNFQSRLAAALRAKGEYFAQRLDGLSSALESALALYRERAERRLERAETRLALLSPYSVLERGYSLTTDAAGNVVRDATALNVGDRLVTRLMKGEVLSDVVAAP